MKKILVDTLSLSRIFLGILFFYFTFFDFNIIYLVIIFILTAVSDFFDGRLARKFNISSYNGAMLDVISDFIFIIFSTSALIFIELAPFWFLFIIILKMIEFFATSSSNNGLYYEKLGHTVALMFYAFPIVAVLINSKSISLILCIFISVCAILSSVLRIKEVC